MDELDMQALRLLSQNGRMTWAELSQHLGLSGPATAERVRRLEEKGVITGYSATVDRELLGFGLTAFVDVDLVAASKREAFLERIANRPEVLECHHVTGDHDYLLKIASRNPRHIDHLLNTVLKADGLIARTRTVIVLSSAKEAPFSPPTGDDA